MSAGDQRHYAGICGLCGKKRTILQIRSLVGAADGEDVVRVVAELVASHKALKAVGLTNPEGVPENASTGRPGAPAGASE